MFVAAIATRIESRTNQSPTVVMRIPSGTGRRRGSLRRRRHSGTGVAATTRSMALRVLVQVAGAALQSDAMGQHRHGEALDVVRDGIAAPLAEGERLGRPEERLGAAGGDAEQELAAVARGLGERQDVLGELLGDPHRGRPAPAGPAGSRGDSAGCSWSSVVLDAARQQQLPLVGARRIAQRERHQEAVELRLGEREGALVLESGSAWRAPRTARAGRSACARPRPGARSSPRAAPTGSSAWRG